MNSNPRTLQLTYSIKGKTFNNKRIINPYPKKKGSLTPRPLHLRRGHFNHNHFTYLETILGCVMYTINYILCQKNHDGYPTSISLIPCDNTLLKRKSLLLRCIIPSLRLHFHLLFVRVTYTNTTIK